MFRINELVGEVKYAASALPRTSLGSEGTAKGDPWSMEEKLHYGTLSVVGWSDEAYGGQLAEGECGSGHSIGLMSSS